MNPQFPCPPKADLSCCLVEFDESCRKYREHGKALNDALYDLCERHPDHQHYDGVLAKIGIIGRTYATGIERQTVLEENEKGQSAALTKVTNFVWEHRGRIDGYIKQLHSMAEPLTASNLQTIVSVHWQFVALLRDIPLRNAGGVSFASKYLHFHIPVVPIYDSVAVKNIGKMYSRMKLKQEFAFPEGAEDKYAKFVLQFWNLYEWIRSKRKTATVKLIDEYLIVSFFSNKL